MTENENKTAFNDPSVDTSEETVKEGAANEQTEANGAGTDYSYAQQENAQTFTPAAKPLPPENVVAGTVGALLFSIVGAIAYFIIYQFGYIAGICGLITVVCAIKGYALFGKRESIKGIIIAVVISVIALIAAEYVSIAYIIYDSINEGFASGVLDYTISLADAIAVSFSLILETPDLLSSVLKDIAIMLALSAVGAFSSIRNAVASVKSQSNGKR